MTQEYSRITDIEIFLWQTQSTIIKFISCYCQSDVNSTSTTTWFWPWGREWGGCSWRTWWRSCRWTRPASGRRCWAPWPSWPPWGGAPSRGRCPWWSWPRWTPRRWSWRGEGRRTATGQTWRTIENMTMLGFDPHGCLPPPPPFSLSTSYPNPIPNLVSP